ncbi:helix-turn-helix domain-containing protein [Halobacillus sp. B23F22_1]|uniref:helix-turn-helix domain-containing protein n=1 Tax=Halobacillus sp. B23F22_1 TaxID=3459514 RepID=UPI00373E943B
MSRYKDRSQIGSHLKLLLKKNNLSMRKLSERTSIDTATISRIINGKREANLHHLEKFAHAFDVPLRDLLAAAGYEPFHKLESDLESVVQQMTGDSESFTLEEIEERLTEYERLSSKEEGRQTILKDFQEKYKSVGNGGSYIQHLLSFYERFQNKKSTARERALLGSALIYFIFTMDAIPDYMFPVGYIDDAIAIQYVLHGLSDKA